MVTSGQKQGGVVDEMSKVEQKRKKNLNKAYDRSAKKGEK